MEIQASFYLRDDVKSTEELADFLKDHGEEPHIGMGAFASLASLYSIQESSAAKITAERLTAGREGALESFHQRLRDSKALMADDLVFLCHSGNATGTQGLPQYGLAKNSKHILLDDFQNIRPQQYEFLSRLLPDDGSMLIAVDPDQAVQNWRGGEPHHIDQVLLQSPGAELFQFKKNYRGTRPLVEITNRLSSEPSKPAATPIPRGYQVVKPGLIRIDGTVEEMDEYILSQIETAVNWGHSHSEIACLSRHLSTLTRLATKCDEREIPCLLYASNRNDELNGYRLNAVSLSTIEAAQGEEWRTVWVVYVNDSIIPGPIPEPHTRRLEERNVVCSWCVRRGQRRICSFATLPTSPPGSAWPPLALSVSWEGLVEESVVRPGEPEIPAN